LWPMARLDGGVTGRMVSRRFHRPPNGVKGRGEAGRAEQAPLVRRNCQTDA
jgi:hypothetical protein